MFPEKSSLPEVLLKAAGLSITRIRKAILERFVNTEHAISNAELQNIFKQEFDRVTLYRTLHALVQKKVLHLISSENLSQHYALNPIAKSNDKCRHLHFKCTNCGKTFCLTGTQVPAIELPGGYHKAESEMLVTGTCKQCNHSL
jgi:Fur family transcriptional regulator, ferric uptake regulator